MTFFLQKGGVLNPAAQVSIVAGEVMPAWNPDYRGWITDSGIVPDPDCELAVIGSGAGPVPTLQEYQDAIQTMLDAEARNHGYDNILSACTYATCSVERFRTEGQACVDWRGAVWAAGYAILDEVTAHTIPQPTIADLLGMLPKITWPNTAPPK